MTAVTIHEDVPKQHVIREINVTATVDNAEPVLKSRTKTVMFTPTKLAVQLMKINDGPVSVSKIVLSDSQGNQSFVGVDWRETASTWLVNYVSELLKRSWENGGLRRVAPSNGLAPTVEEIQAHRLELALYRNDPFVNPQRVKCAYDRCGNVQQKVGDEHPWVTARNAGWKLTWGASDPTGTDLYCALDHDDMGNPIYKK